MPLKRDIYKRTYIMFEQDEKGCSLIKDKEVTGYLKVETRAGRGRITASLQNLNPSFTYNVKFLKNGDNPEIVDFGAVRVDDKGRGGAEWTFDTTNINGNKIKFNELSVAFVEGRNNDTIIPLSSVLDKKRFNWKYIYNKLLNNKVKEEIPIEEKVKQTETTPETKHKEDNLPKYNDEGDQEINPEIYNKKESTTYDEGTHSKEDIEISKPKIETDLHKENEDENDKETAPDKAESEGYRISDEEENNGYIKYLREYVNNIINYLNEVHPFDKDIKGYRWWKISTGYRDGNYDHYLVGFVNDENGKLKYIVYGMPGLFTLSDQPFGGMTGFVYWVPLKENMRGSGDMGYWLMHIDAVTGQIAIPNGPTPPPLI